MRNRILIAGSVAVSVMLLAGAAFVAGQMWSREEAPDGASGGAPPDVASDGGASGATLIAKLEGARELPQRSPDIRGVFSRKEDNRVFVSSGDQGIMYTLEGEVMSAGDAREVEVVVTSETVVYKDVTQESLGTGPLPGNTIKQKLEAGQVEEIGTSSVVIAWGEKRGERLVADILVYTGPPVIVR